MWRAVQKDPLKELLTCSISKVRLAQRCLTESYFNCECKLQSVIGAISQC